MKIEIAVLILILLVLPSAIAAENTSASNSGILSSLPEIKIDSADSYTNSTGDTSNSQSRLNWIIILGLTFLGVVMYSFEIDPKWIVLLIGVTGLIALLLNLGVLSV